MSQCSAHPFVGNSGVWGMLALLLAFECAPSVTPTFPGNAAAHTEVSHLSPSQPRMARGCRLVPGPQATSAWEGPGRRSEAPAPGPAPGRVSVSGGHLQLVLPGRGWGATPPYGPSSSTGHGPPQPRLEDEIDFLAQELAGQEAGRWGVTALPQPEAPHRLLEPGETWPHSPA